MKELLEKHKENKDSQREELIFGGMYSAYSGVVIGGLLGFGSVFGVLGVIPVFSINSVIVGDGLSNIAKIEEEQKQLGKQIYQKITEWRWYEFGKIRWLHDFDFPIEWRSTEIWAK